MILRFGSYQSAAAVPVRQPGEVGADGGRGRVLVLETFCVSAAIPGWYQQRYQGGIAADTTKPGQVGRIVVTVHR